MNEWRASSKPTGKWMNERLGEGQPWAMTKSLRTSGVVVKRPDHQDK
jgi:hypothetical protein